MGSYTYSDIVEALQRKGHSVKTLYYSLTDKYEDEFLEERLLLELNRGKYDAVFSVNFFPIVSKAAFKKSIPYISWSYDSPLEEGFEEYFGYSTNFIFLFDREEVGKYVRKGYNNVFHLPLAVNLSRLDSLDYSRNKDRYETDISFVGSLYNSDLNVILALCDDYVKGYVESLMQVQLELYGTNLVDKSVNEDIVKRVNASYIKNGQENVSITKSGLSFAILKHLTNIERTLLINELAESSRVKFYGFDGNGLNSKVDINGPLKYFSEMNYAFRDSRINLCPTLKSISSGIPLRALDIMGAGGLLLSNYQPELAEYFIDGESVVMYESLSDAIEKAEYYLNNDEERCRIIANSRRVLEEAFTYDSRIETMMGIVFG